MSRRAPPVGPLPPADGARGAPLAADADFLAALEDPATCHAADLSVASDTLLVAFGGLMGALGIPPFEFFGMTRELPVKRLFVRDLQQAWYQAGLPGIGGDPPAVARWLDRTIREAEVERVVLVGNSMGGYGALLFGTLVGSPALAAVHAFSPQTFLGRWRRAWARDRRWKRQVRRAQARGRAPWLDLRPVLRRGDGARCPLDVHASATDRLDRLHAERLAGLPRVRLHAHAAGGHDLVKGLKRDGTLGRILRDAVAG